MCNSLCKYLDLDGLNDYDVHQIAAQQETAKLAGANPDSTLEEV
jgi:hypothetical protein